jgi:hypothetical protein
MSSNNNLDNTESPNASIPIDPKKLTAIVNIIQFSSGIPNTLVNPKALIYWHLGNDDLVKPLNKNFTDGGIVSSQISAGISLPITKGFLKKGSITSEVSATTFTGWDSHTSGNNAEQSYKKKPIIDGYQAPKGERYNFTVAANKPIKTGAHQSLDLGMRIDVARVTGETPIQDTWHGIGGANYYRTRTNKVEDQHFVSAEATSAYHFTKDTPKKQLDVALLGGAAYGNGYKGGMAGVEFSLGSASSRCFSQTTHSATYGNSNTEHTTQGGHAKPGALKVSGYAKVFLSDGNDYRSNAKSDAFFGSEIEYLEIQGKRFGNQFLGNAIIGSGSVPQYNIVNYTEQVPYKPSTGLDSYHFNKVNIEGGVRGQYQLSNSINIGAKLSAWTNPITPDENNNPLAALNNEYAKIKGLGLKYTTIITNNSSGIIFAPGLSTFYAQHEYGYTPQLGTPSFKETMPEAGPKMTFSGEVSVSVQLGGHHKKAGHTR